MSNAATSLATQVLSEMRAAAPAAYPDPTDAARLDAIDELVAELLIEAVDPAEGGGWRLAPAQ